MERSTVTGSAAIGATTGLGSTVIDSRFAANGSWGVFAGPGSVVTGNSAHENGTPSGTGGIWTADSTVRGNSSYGDAGTGILAVGACTVTENTVGLNGGVGLDLGDETGYAGNVVFDNTGMAISGGRAVGANICNGAPCPAPCPATCSNDVTVVSRYDIVTGSCSKHFAVPCAPYSCGQDGSCKTTCVTDADCGQGAGCETSMGRCTPIGWTCSDQDTVLSPDGTGVSCSPYACRAGACLERCTVLGDCAPPFICVANTCVTP